MAIKPSRVLVQAHCTLWQSRELCQNPERRTPMWVKFGFRVEIVSFVSPGRKGH